MKGEKYKDEYKKGTVKDRRSKMRSKEERKGEIMQDGKRK